MIKKKLYKMIIALIFVLLILPCGAFINVSASENNVNNTSENNVNNIEEEISYNSIIIIIKKEKSLEFKDYSFNDFISANNGTIIELTEETSKIVKSKLLNVNNYSNIKINIDYFKRILLLQFNEVQETSILYEYIEFVKNHPDVEYAGPDYISYEAVNLPTDPEYEDGNQWAIDSLNLSDAWEFVTGTNDILVGVIDTGIDGTH